MTQNHSRFDRGSRVSAVWTAALCLMLPLAAVANTSNSIPYAETFEQYTNGTFLVGSNGWYAEDEEAVQVTTSAYTKAYFSELPLPSLAHTNVMKLELSVTNEFRDSESDGQVWIDMMLQPTRWQEDEAPEVPDDTQMALFVDSNGQINAYCQYLIMGVGYTSGWARMTHFPVQSNEWVRLTMHLRYDVPGSPNDFYSLRLNGSEPVTHAYGLTNFYNPTTTNGSWFMTVARPHKLNSVGFSGTGYLDDLVVTNGEIVPIVPQTVIAIAHKGGILTPFGAVPVSPGASPVFTMDEEVGYNRTNAAWGVGTGLDYQQNSIAYATNYLGVTNQFIFADVDTNYVLHLFTEPEGRTLRIVNIGEVGTLVPPAGDYPTTYDTVTNCSILYADPINTWTTRHYCTYSRTTSSDVSNKAGTNTTFTIKGDESNSVTTLTWNWRLQNWLNTETVGTAGFTAGDGYVDVADGWWNTNMSFTITATPNSDDGVGTWDFTHWSGTTQGCTVASNLITVSMDVPRTNVTAHFTYLANPATNWNLVVSYSDAYTNYFSDYDGAQPAVGTNANIADGTITNCVVIDSPRAIPQGEANALTQMVCNGWTKIAGRVPPSGTTTNTGTFILTQDSELIWNWALEYYVDIQADDNGTVDTLSGWHAEGAFVSDILAEADPGYVFSTWEGDDVPIGSETNNPLSLTVDGPKTLLATFVLDSGGALTTSNGTPHAWITKYYPATNDYESCDVADTDKDGKKTWEEYVTGTDPTDSGSVFGTLNLHYTASANRVAFYGTTNSGVTSPFSMYRADDLLKAWLLVATNSIARSADGTNVWWDNNPLTNGAAFYLPAASTNQ